MFYLYIVIPDILDYIKKEINDNNKSNEFIYHVVIFLSRVSSTFFQFNEYIKEVSYPNEQSFLYFIIIILLILDHSEIIFQL